MDECCVTNYIEGKAYVHIVDSFEMLQEGFLDKHNNDKGFLQYFILQE
jgi:hypothetical protein